MGAVSLNEINVTLLKRISTPGGDVMHAMNHTDPGYLGFGEVYFSWVEAGVVKAWKCHRRMSLNLVAPLGCMRFVFHQEGSVPAFRVEVIGEARYARLTVPPGFWFGFQGLGEPRSLLMNVADLPHDPEEVLRKSVEEIQYNWSGE